MADAQDEPTPLNDRRFASMSGSEKLVFIWKVCIFLVSGGFIYPTVWVD